MIMKELVNSYVEWIKQGLTLREVGNGWHEVTTPFLNHKNDMIELFLKHDDNQVLLSDGGNTISELILSGVNIDNSKRRSNELNSIIRSFGIQRNGDNEIYARTDARKFPEVKHRLIQAILAIDDLFVLAEPKVESFFIEDVEGFFDLNDVIFVKDTFFTGKSGFTHKFDFTLPKIKERPETVVRAINLPRKDNIGNVIWAFEDTRNARPETNGLVILNDTNNDVQLEISQALNQYGLRHINWSQRNENLQKLRA